MGNCVKSPLRNLSKKPENVPQAFRKGLIETMTSDRASLIIPGTLAVKVESFLKRNLMYD
ncbi:hypothetical protein Nmel_015558 [Mimus melanotis]